MVVNNNNVSHWDFTHSCLILGGKLGILGRDHTSSTVISDLAEKKYPGFFFLTSGQHTVR